MRALVNDAVRQAVVAPPSPDALAYHRALPGYRSTPVRDLVRVAEELGLASVRMKDESARLGLPAFKVLGASWATERILESRPEVRMLVAASAGNHGRAVAHVAALRGLDCRIFLPARASDVRRAAIEGEGAEVVVVDGDYEDAVAAASAAGADEGVAEIADVGTSDGARWVIDGYATLFAELSAQGTFDVLVVPIGVGSLGAAAARHAASTGAKLVGVEPVTAACLTASLAAGKPTSVATPGTTMAGLDCAEVSVAAAPGRRPRHRRRVRRRGRRRRPRAGCRRLRDRGVRRCAARRPARARDGGRVCPAPRCSLPRTADACAARRHGGTDGRAGPELTSGGRPLGEHELVRRAPGRRLAMPSPRMLRRRRARRRRRRRPPGGRRRRDGFPPPARHGPWASPAR